MKKEIWKDIPGYEGLYKVSNLGNVKSLKRNGIKGIILKGEKDEFDYKRVTLCKKNKTKKYKVHRLVAQAFIPNPNNLPQINHKDENSKNNNVENLEWCTAKYNSNYGNHNEKIRQRMLQNNPFKGKHHSPKTLEKLRLAKLGRHLSEEQKKKIGVANKGKGRIGKKVYCVELNKTFNSVVDAEKQLGIFNPNIVQVCLGKRKTAGGYHWWYIKEI